MQTPKVSVIIPVYKVEKYIERCVRSLFEQTLNELEFIFIDDCGGDDSINIITRILEKYPTRQSQVKIIHHNTNLGVGQSRQDGINAAIGEYIIHCDPDDSVAITMYEKMYNTAIETRADFVMCGYSEFNNIGRHDYLLQPIPDGRIERIKAFSARKIKGGLWNKLIHRKRYSEHQICFEFGIDLWEDKGAIIKFLITAEKTAYVAECLYYYHRNDQSLTANLTCKKIDSMIAVAKDVISFIERYGVSTEYIRQIAFDSKKNLLITGNGCYNPKKWRETFPEYNRYVFKIRATPLVRMFYILAICHIDFISRIYVSRPPFLLKIKHFLLR